MAKAKEEWRDRPCANCGGLHYGSYYCPYAVPYDGDDSLGEKRGLQATMDTMDKKTGCIKKVTTQVNNG
jgi:hypothetical protein